MLIIRWLFNALVLLAITAFVPGVEIDGLPRALIAALVLGFLNTILRPILILLTLPANIVTLGLFTFVINAVIFLLAARLLSGFSVSGFWAAFWGALIMSVAGLALSIFVRDRD